MDFPLNIARRVALGALALLGAAATPADAAPSAQREHYTATLLTEQSSLASGGRLSVALRIEPKPGWHIYWANPGDTGYAPNITWTMPAGFLAGQVQHPAPTRLVLQGLVSFVHEGRTTLLQDIAVPPLPASTKPVKLAAQVDLLVCSQGSCVPDPVDLDVTLPAGAGARDPANAKAFAEARAALPAPLGDTTLFTFGKGNLSLRLPGLSAAPGDVALFVEQPGVVAPQTVPAVKSADGALDLTAAASTPPGATLSGVVMVRGVAHGFAARRVAALPAQAPTAFDATFLIVLATAMLGGLVLNLMPCVFPILSLKAISLARYSQGEDHARIEALGYSAGVIGTVVALGGVLLALRAGGSAAGWAFQLQNPLVVGALLLLVVGIAFNLAGLFELPSPSISMSGGKSGLAGSVATGALAAFVATPCTGPFMAGALGAALVMPTLPALGVMAGLGLGMAAPFLLLGFVPATRRWIPRPGQWMVTLRHAMSVPMFATALGLAWIVGRQAGVSAMTAALAAATVLGLGLWWYGARRAAGRSGHVALPAALAAALILALGVEAAPVPSAAAATAPSGEDALHSKPFSSVALAELSARRKPVFLYLTADWCLSCKVNEATTLSSARVARAFAARGVTVLRGDWTRQDPEISRFLSEHGRAGVPLYLWYAPSGRVEELPQVLAPDMLIALAAQAEAA